MSGAAIGNTTSEMFSYSTLLRTLKALLKRLWLLAASAIALGLVFFIVAAVTYVEVYNSNMVIALTTGTYVKTYDENGNQSKVLTNQKIYDESDANKYLVLLRSDYIVDKITAEMGSGFSKSEARDSLTISKASNTGIFKISANNKDKNFCEKALEVANKYFPEYLKDLDPSIGVVVVNSPQEPIVANKHSSIKSAGLGFLLGAVLVAAGVYISELVRDTVRSSDDARVKLNARFLGMIPNLEQYSKTALNKKTMRGPLLSNENSVSFAFIESFKSIRAKVENNLQEYDKNIFAVTSTFEDEGKTTLSINLACALAQTGKSVLLMGCDLRRPAVLKMAGIKEEGRPGIIQIVKGTETCDSTIKFVRSLGLFILPGGGTSGKATEIIASDEFKELLERVKSEFDYVVLDTPPARVVSDCLTMVPVVNSIVYAVREDYAKANNVADTLSELEIAGANIIGTVLTMTTDGEDGSFYNQGMLGLYKRGRTGNGSYYGYEREAQTDEV